MPAPARGAKRTITRVVRNTMTHQRTGKPMDTLVLSCGHILFIGQGARGVDEAEHGQVVYIMCPECPSEQPDYKPVPAGKEDVI
jgi:hypothetical protein